MPSFAAFIAALVALADEEGDRAPLGPYSGTIIQTYLRAGRTWPFGRHPWRLGHARDFLPLSGVALVAMAYRTLLFRNPDSQGLSTFLSQDGCKWGQRRMELLVRLRLSREGRSHRTKLRGLWRETLKELAVRVFPGQTRSRTPDPRAEREGVPIVADRWGDDLARDGEHTCKPLLDSAPAKASTSDRDGVVAAVPFPLWPPRSGGQLRAYHLLRELARHYEVHAVCLAEVGTGEHAEKIAPGLHEWRVPRTAEHARRESAITSCLGVAADDIALIELLPCTPAYAAHLRKLSTRAIAAVSCHPYVYPALRGAVADLPVWYDAQDVEIELKRALIPPGPLRDEWLLRVCETEQACCLGSDRVLACSDEDASRISSLFGVEAGKLLVVPNGVDTEATKFAGIEERLRVKGRLGCEDTPLALFIGSAHQPNVEALRHLNHLAAEVPEVRFLVAGAVAYSLEDDPCTNVWLVGDVSAPVKRLLLRAADIAVNPMTTGSGTALKVLEFMASGVPILSTWMGVRGLGLESGRSAIIADVAQFAPALRALLADEKLRMSVAWEARQLVESRFSWNVIGASVLEALLASTGGQDDRERP